ncbi:14081_t:CDS:2, partial [Acaulospora colombiana]
VKMDQYHNHIYVSLLLHVLEEPESAENSGNLRMGLLQREHRKGGKYLETHKELRKMKLHVAAEQRSGTPVYNPILARIEHSKTILRTSQDASLLMEAVIDAIVDLALPIIDSYQQQIAELEGELLIQPKMDYMRELHMISGELALLKKTLAPVKGLVSVLIKLNGKTHITELAKTYFADVSDHCIDIVDNLEAMLKVTENLVNL